MGQALSTEWGPVPVVLIFRRSTRQRRRRPTLHLLPSLLSLCFVLLIAEVKSFTWNCHMNVWKTTVCELFAVEYPKLLIRVEAFPPQKALSTLKDAQGVAKIARSLGNGLLATKLVLTELIRKLSSQHKRAKAPILNLWATFVRHGTASIVSTAATPTTEYNVFLFDASRFTPADVAHPNSCVQIARLRVRNCCCVKEPMTSGKLSSESRKVTWRDDVCQTSSGLY
uniref:Uncharacterized protein n=1 Tax=Peronospora matthiolae TaxID=2874970 RepID=A0AAV1V1I5_9STRA